jgi:MscS family membrane protein
MRPLATLSLASAHPFFERHLPAPLLAEGPRGLLWWQWLAIPVFVGIAVIVGALLGWITRRVLGKLAARTQTTWDDALLHRVTAPLNLLWAIAVFTALRPALDLDADAAEVVSRVLRSATLFGVFWAGFRSLDLAIDAAAAAPWSRTNQSLSGLLPLGRKLGKMVLLAIGLVSVLNELGFQVASLLAGLGIGGIALALAAQKTVENLFGSVAIGVDQPFRVGDFVKIEDVTGTVETIGMRSTRIRTLDRTLVSVPNSQIANVSLETLSARDKFWFHPVVALRYETTAEQLQVVIDQIRRLLEQHSSVSRESVRVRFFRLGPSSLDIEVFSYVFATDWTQFLEIQERLLIDVTDIVGRAGTAIAFPSQTMYLTREKAEGTREKEKEKEVLEF